MHMEVEKGRAVTNLKELFQRNLFPITIISSILISGSIGYTTSQIVVKNNVGNKTEISTIKNQVNEARNKSTKVIETELSKIISDLDKYNRDIDLLVKNVKWLKENLAPIKDVLGKFELASNVANGVNTIVNIPIVDNVSTKLDFAQSQFDEIDSILSGLDKLTIIQHEMSDSQKKLNSLFEKYQKEKNIEQLIQIEQELNSNLIYQIEDLRNATIETQKVFELSSGVLTTVVKTKSFVNSVEEVGKDTLNTIQFWKEDKAGSETEVNIKESLGKDLEAKIKKIQKMPNELDQRSKSSITSISNVQKELQIIKIAQMISSE